MLNLNGKPMLERQIQRILTVVNPDQLTIATSSDVSDDLVESFCDSLGIRVVRGSLYNVYSRFQQVLNELNCEYFVRLTGDCPFFMPKLFLRMVNRAAESEFDYFSNTLHRDFPRGLDIEIVKTQSFLQLNQFDLNLEELEHVTLGLYQRPQIFKVVNYSENKNLALYRWTVDTAEDYNYAVKVFRYFEGKESVFEIEDLVRLMTFDSNYARLDFKG